MKGKSVTQRVRSIAGAGILVLAITALIVPPAQGGSSQPVRSEISTGLAPAPDYQTALRHFRASEIAAGLAPTDKPLVQRPRASEISTGIAPPELLQTLSSLERPKAESRHWGDLSISLGLGLVAGMMAVAGFVAVSRHSRVRPSR
jgi:hypothetical protein